MSSPLSFSLEGRTLQFIISIIVYRITVFYVVPTSTKFSEGNSVLIHEQHRTRTHVSSRAPLRLLFYCARLNDHEEIKLLPPCASSCTRMTFPVNIYFRPRKRHLSRLSFPQRLGKLNTRRMIHKVIENFVVYTIASNHESATELK